MASDICFAVFLIVALCSLCAAENLVSQISPKSKVNKLVNKGINLHSSVKPKAVSIKSSILMSELSTPSMPMNHDRQQRSAMPIMNDRSVHTGYSELKEDILNFENNEVDSSGRYYSFISPTKSGYNNDDLHGVMTKSLRIGKDISDDSFLEKGDPRLIPSGSPIKPITATQTFPAATVGNGARQNPNPDIQDIITGIVKLLNGNVNVHANTQPTRRPIATRINNRGPPRISESQPLPNEYEGSISLSPPNTSARPPYPFDRPEGPIRPFITGVPIPEQIVPSMQQNYRPGFVSQNRPPWQRPRPRPPITVNRRPIPPYKPIPPLPEYRPDEEHTPIPITDGENNTVADITTTELEDDIVEPEAIEEHSEDVSDISEEEEEEETEKPVTEPAPKKDEILKKKDKNSYKSTEKIPVVPVLIESTISEQPTTESIHMIINSMSELDSVQYLASTALPQQENDIVQPSIEEDLLTTATTTTTISHTPIMNTTYMSKMTISTTESIIIQTTTSSSQLTKPTILSSANSSENFPYHPRPGIVLDDPEFKPGGGNHRSQPPQRPRPPIQATRPSLPGYGEIFDVTLSAIQGPGSGSGSKQTVKIKPYGSYQGQGQIQHQDNGEIIVSPSGDEGFVSIDGKRTYINLFGDPTDHPTATSTSTTVKPTQTVAPGITGTGYAVAETEAPQRPPQQQVPPPQPRPHHRPRPQQPPVRIDTCIVGDDSTCDQAQNEKCKTDSGVSSCHCRPGYARRKHREPCRRIVSLLLSLRVDKIYERRIVWDNLFHDTESEPYQQLSYEAVRAMDSAMSMTPFSDEFLESKVNRIYTGDATQGAAGVFVNLTLKLEENGETLRPALKSDIQRHLLGVIHRRNNNIGNSALYVESPPGSVSNLQDVDECTSPELNDCNADATCTNIWGSFRCECHLGYRDPWADQPQRAGRECQTCPDTYCNNRGTCVYDSAGNQGCRCVGSYYGTTCEIDGEVLGVAVGASVAAVIIIVLTLICLVMWSRRWQREHKNAIGSPVFGYMGGGQVKTPVMGQTPYQVTLEDRMRWAQIADVMAQANHYAYYSKAEPVAGTRPSSAMFGYPNLQTMGSMNTLGTMSLAGTIPMHTGTLPPVPLPRLGLNRPSGMRTLENSSSSEEEDRTDLLGRNFHVPRPKSRSNASITSGIYYDVDYAPSGNEQLYGMSGNGTSTTNTATKAHSGIPMSTYTSNGRTPQSYYK